MLYIDYKLSFGIGNFLTINVIKPTFLISDWKKIKFFKTSLNKKNPLVFLFCFWGPLKLLRPLKKFQILESWHQPMPKQIRHWMGLVWKKCPVSRVEVMRNIRRKKLWKHLMNSVFLKRSTHHFFNKTQKGQLIVMNFRILNVKW